MDLSDSKVTAHSIPRQLDQAEMLIRIMRKKTPAQLGEFMKISESLAEQTADRFRSFSTPFTRKNAKQAILAFDGDVYAGMEANSLTDADLAFADLHLRILSGLYGLLKPMDLIQPYRLEMGSRLKTSRGTNLYQFWGNRITDLLNRDIAENHVESVLNLTSNEYWRSINRKKLTVPVYTAQFLENRGGTYKFISFSGKRARGMMTRFIIQNRIVDPKDIRAFDSNDYIYNEEMSGSHEFVFTKG